MSNTGDANAYDVILEDFIPGASFKTDQILFAENLPAGWTATLDPVVANEDVDTTVRIVSDPGVALEPGAALSFEFSLPVDDAIAVASSIVNTANLIQVTSLDRSVPHPDGIEERDSGGATASDDIVMANADLGFSFVSSSESDTSDVDGLPALTIGERARVRVDVDLPDGTFVNPTLILELPDGIDFVGSNFSDGMAYPGLGYDGFYGSMGSQASASFSGVVDGDPTPDESMRVDGSGVAVHFVFNSLVNLPDGNPDNDDFHFYIEVVCVDVPDLVGYGDSPTELSAGIRLLGSHAAADATAGGVSFRIVEPKIVISKTMSPIDPAVPDVVGVSITVFNEGTSSAHDLRIEDALNAAYFDLNSVVPVVTPQDFTVSNEAGVVSYLSNSTSLLPGASISMDFTVAVLPMAPSPLLNTARVVSSSSLNHNAGQPANIGERTGAIVAAEAQVGIPVVSLMKKVMDLDYTGEPLRAGDQVEYTLTVTNEGGGLATSVALLDSIPAYTSYVVGSMELNGVAYTPTLPDMSFDLGALSPGESQSVVFRVEVDAVLPVEAREISNSSSLTYAERSVSIVSDNDATGHAPVLDDGVDDPSDTGALTSDDDPTALPLLQAAITERSYLAFEDLKNRGWSDWDHNDLLLDITTHYITDAAGAVESVIVLYQIIARGAAYEAQVYLTIPYVGGAAWKTEYLETDGTLISSASGSDPALMTAQVYHSTRQALEPYAEGRYDWGASRTERFDPTLPGRRAVVRLMLNEPSSNPLEGFSQSPHDTWAHMVNTGEDVHRVEYELGNTQIALEGPLAGRSLPLVVEFSEGFDWPAENKRIYDSHPQYVDYIKSGGTTHLDWWKTYNQDLVWVDDEGNVPGVANFTQTSFSLSRMAAFMSSIESQAEPSAWPKRLPSLVTASPLLRDLTGDGSPELLISCMDGNVYIFDHTGDTLPGWPQAVEIRPTGNILDLWLRASPGVGDIDGDGELDIVVGAPSGRLYAWGLDGALKSKFPVNLGSIKSVCTVVDIVGDEAAEIIVHSGQSKLYVLDGNANALPGWPQDLGGETDQFGSWMIGSSPTVFDLHLDGSLQIAVGSTANKVHLFNADGSAVPGWPATSGDWVYPSVTAVDLNGDYEPEIVVGSGDNQVYAWDADCALLPGFPVTLDAAIVGSIAAADLSGNGVNELVATTMAGSVYVLSAEGGVRTGWPKTALAGIIASPVVIDVDGDGGLDVVAASRDNWLYAWDADGTAISELTLKANDWIESTPAAGDIDGDGLIELVYASYDGTIDIVDLGSVASAANLAWPAFRGDRARVSDAVVTDVDGDSLPDAFELAVFGNYATSGQNDEDGDGMTNAAEWIAGTSLLDVSDYFSVVSGTTNVGGVRQFELAWQANAGRRYKVYCSATLADEAAWELADLQHASDDGEMLWTVDMPTGVPCQFFRVVVERGNQE